MPPLQTPGRILWSSFRLKDWDHLFWLSLIPWTVRRTVKMSYICISLENPMVSIGQSLTKIYLKKILATGFPLISFQRFKDFRAEKTRNYFLYVLFMTQLPVCSSDCLVYKREIACSWNRRGRIKKLSDVFLESPALEPATCHNNSKNSSCPMVQMQVEFEENPENSFIFVFLPSWLQILVPSFWDLLSLGVSL